MQHAIHTSDRRKFKKLWKEQGGLIIPILGTGEVRFVHPAFVNGIRADDRRNDVQAKLLSRLNALRRRDAANDPKWADDHSR